MRHRLTTLDRALLRLLDERARIVRASRPWTPLESDVHRADLVRRATGVFPAAALVRVLAEIEAGSAGGER